MKDLKIKPPNMFQDNQVFNFSVIISTVLTDLFKKVEIGLKKKLVLLGNELNKLFILSGKQKSKLEQLIWDLEGVVRYQQPLKFVFYN